MSRRKRRILKSKRNKINNLDRKILDIFNKNSNRSLNYKQIAAKLEITDANGRNQIVKELQRLKGQNRLDEVDRGKFILVPLSHYHEGIVEVTSRGNAYVICEDLEHDIYIPSRNLNKALHNDYVKVYIYKRQKNKKQEGDIVEIIEREKSEFVGVLQKNKNFGFVVPDDPKMYVDIFISPEELNDAKDGDKVLATITDWPKNSKNPFGRITQVLGRPGDHDTEIHSILLEYGLPYSFPEEVEAYASKIPIEITKEEIAKRRDMRKDLTFTIDPKDAKDFDDALSFKVLKNGNFEIGVHIADVSHYVKENTVLEDEAYDRATSVYLVDRVVPMLPEILSNNVCSLRPNEEKLTFSVVFEMNDKGHVVKPWFGRTVTFSDQRFTYEEAQEIIEGNTDGVKSSLVKAITTLDGLAKKIRKRRMQNGAISFDKTEVKFNLDDKANPIGVYIKESKDANKLIEEFMLLANRRVAEFISKKKKTFVYRVHDEPNIDKLALLQGIITKFGYSINTNTRESTSESLNKLLEEVHGKAESNMIETLTIRSMSKAIYTTDNIGHYGLAFDHYTHFTSPIRRYPDVMAHRLLQLYLDGRPSVKAEKYEEKCSHSSEKEFLASKAERDSIKYMQIKYMQDHEDQEFEGVISGVTEWGIYVEIIENKCEGMVRIKDIQSDYFIFDEKQYALIGQADKRMYQLGDQVTVTVKNTDLERKHLDFNLIED
ncbi:ribonuclease R [Lutimonas zeaxanthinifaciens]|uniref:ribonuclease R n=1 Tax=Lutimonas zeaxanthinifaciens TaxID=3060215 RepID=UPI00265CC96B|nr:ribonuclease R [Lutimonas sp. YSD2104]WKK66023.1 ribonuclease R [Lutimonas sp. YSD2104]